MPRRWWKALGLGVVIACAPVLVFAADQALTQRVQAFADRLQLDQQTRAKVQEIAEYYAGRRQQIHEELMQRLTKLRDQETRETRALLTPQQQAQYDQMRSHPKTRPAQSATQSPQ